METLNEILGLHAHQLEPHQMAARAVVMFFFALILLRIAGMRAIGRHSAFDVLTLLMTGSIIGRSVVAEQSLLGTMAAGLALVLLHRLIAWVSFKSSRVGKVLKGENLVLMHDGKNFSENCAKQQITKEDIIEALRSNVQSDTLDDIKEIHLERSGEISFVCKKKHKEDRSVPRPQEGSPE